MKYLLHIISIVGFVSLLSAYEGIDDSEYTFETRSLVGFEGGYTTFDVEEIPDQGNGIQKYEIGEVGIKIGAQTKDYRIFLSIRSYFPEGYDYFVTYGGEFQYLFSFSKYANFFIGINGGMLDGRFKIAGESESRTLSDPYFGGDAGFNIHIGENYDLEIGGRVMTSDAQNTKNNLTYKFDNLVTGYASLIIKFSID